MNFTFILLESAFSNFQQERLNLRIEKIQEDIYILRGKLKDISDYQDIKLLLEKIRKAQINEISFGIPHAKDISLYILGYWLKLAKDDGFKFHFYISDDLLYERFLYLGLHEFFEVINGEME